MDLIDIALEKLTNWLLIAAYYCFGACLAISLGAQGVSWLRTGSSPQRDLYWLVANGDCVHSSGDGWWTDKDACRVAPLHFTDWVGADRIANYLMDINVAVAIFVFATITVGILLAKSSDYADLRSRAEARKKAIESAKKEWVSVDEEE